MAANGAQGATSTDGGGETVSFKDQVVIVTGGGRGLGRAYCLEIARRGGLVVVNDVVGERAEDVVGEITRFGGRALASPESITTSEGGDKVVQAAVDGFGTVDAVIHNAGVLRNNLFEDLTNEQIDAVVDVNLRGAFFVLRPAWSIMKTKGYGRVVLTSSAAGMFTRPGSVNYSAAKAAMWGMCGALRWEGADYGIKVNMLLPGARTVIIDSDPIPGGVEYMRPQPAEAFEARGGGEPEHTAPLVCYLASNACSVSGEAFSSTRAVYARVFVGRAAGWAAPDVNSIAIEDIAAHLDEIRDLEGYSVPRHNKDEGVALAQRLGFVEAAPGV